MNKVYLILGSNMGDKAQYITSAIAHIESSIGRIIKKSSLYTTEPWGMKDTQVFLNQVIVVETDIEPFKVLEKCLQIEVLHGRQRNIKYYEQRTLDIDILFIDQLIIETDLLQIPHPRIAERRFVLEPLAEIYPDFAHIQHNKTISQLLEACTDSLKVERNT